MSPITREMLSADRVRLGNQYAHLEQLEELAEVGLASRIGSTTVDRQALAIYQNPYRYIDAQAIGDAPRLLELRRQTVTGRKGRPIRRERAEIERQARLLLGRIWSERRSLWGDGVPDDPVQMLDPEVGLAMYGFQTDYVEGLGKYRSGESLIEVAGIIDAVARTVQISSQFERTVQMFTTAHELGHAVLHPGRTGVHRDRPTNVVAPGKTHEEWEADYFASCFLMPARLVRSRFRAQFSCDRFEITDEAAFALSGTSVQELTSRLRTRRDLSLLLARASSFNGHNLVPLANQFYVSSEALAIRLEELELVP